MRWTERQRAMLREMGVRLWEREPVLVTEVATEEAEVDAASAVVPMPIADRPAATPTPSPSTPLDPEEAQLPAADWLIVGEPLDGGAGQGNETLLLDNMLRAIGIGRDGATRSLRASYLGVVEPTAGAARLRSAIEIVRPACIVALGRGAAQALLGTDEPLGSLRGRRHEHAGVPVFVTCPLAFLLRHPDEKVKVWADLCLAVAAVDAIRPD